MCGRYAISTDAHELATLFDLVAGPAFAPRWNVAPTQAAPVVHAAAEGRVLEPMHFGLVPFWAKQRSIGNRMINARAETAAEKPAFRRALAKRRCIVPADGFYEWEKVDGAKQPWFVRGADGRPLALAGLWESWRDPAAADGPELRTFAILTTTPNDALRDLHDRMPVVLARADWERWLDPRRDAAAVADLLAPCPSSALRRHRVSTFVNSPAHDDARCVDPID